jgi:hypothetical protein
MFQSKLFRIKTKVPTTQWEKSPNRIDQQIRHKYFVIQEARQLQLDLEAQIDAE